MQRKIEEKKTFDAHTRAYTQCMSEWLRLINSLNDQCDTNGIPGHNRLQAVL